MSANHDLNSHSDHLPTEDRAERLEWIAPAVQRLAATSAEDGFAGVSDGLNPS